MKFWTILSILFVFGEAYGNAPSSAAIEIKQDIVVQKQTGSGGFFEDLEIPYLTADCGIFVKTSEAMVIPAGTLLSGAFNAIEKEFWKDADSLTKEGTTQFSIYQINEDPRIESIGSSCFTSGFVFPTLGLPSLKKLIELSSSVLVFKD